MADSPQQKDVVLSRNNSLLSLGLLGGLTFAFVAIRSYRPARKETSSAKQEPSGDFADNFGKKCTTRNIIGVGDVREPCSDTDWELFRANGRAVVDFIADYYQNKLRSYPVKSLVEPGYLAKTPLGTDITRILTEKGDSMVGFLEDLQKHIVPGVTHWQHPNFFAYFPANTSPMSLCGDMLSGMFNCIAFSWQASPAATELETLVMDRLGELVGLPEQFMSHTKGGGVIQGTASEATLVACLSARQQLRERMPEGTSQDVIETVMKTLVVYGSEQAHSSVKKALMIAGIPLSQYRSIKANRDTNFQMDPEDLKLQMEKDIADKLIPTFVVATLGTTGVGAVDSLGDIGAIAKAHGAWLHVDAAWAGSALVCEEHRWMINKDNGIAFVDSFSFNPHKWMLTNFDCCALWLRQRSYTINALSITPEYLRSKEYDAGYVSDYRDWQVPLGRRFRSLKLWAVMRMYGKQRIREHIRKHCELAEHFERGIVKGGKFEIVAPRNGLSLVCFRHVGWDDAANHKLLDVMNQSGRLMLVHTKLEGRIILRFCVGSPRTTKADVDAAIAEIHMQADHISDSKK